MKVLKYIFVILLLIVLALGALSFVIPTDMKVEESISIDAPKSVVKDQIVYFENSQKWSPWSEIDPDMESWIEGEDGKVGAKYFWSGNEDAGEGSQEITSITEEQMDMKIKFKNHLKVKQTPIFNMKRNLKE